MNVHKKETPNPDLFNEDNKPKAEATDDVKKLKTELDDTKEKLRESDEKYVRLLAEFDNYKKRQRKLFEQMAESLREDVFLKLLDVLDNVERAIAALPDDEKEHPVVEGLKLIEQQIQDILKVEEIEPIDECESFNPSIHEAVQSVPTDARAPGDIIEVLQRGYRKGDRLIRPARVIVAAKSEKKDEQN